MADGRATDEDDSPAARPGTGRGGVLDPFERASEMVFGVIMAMTFTGSVSVADPGEGEIRTMLYAAFGCNVAWGVVDAVMYLLGDVVSRSRNLALVRELRGTQDPARVRALLCEALPEALVEGMSPAEVESLRGQAARLPVPPGPARITLGTLRGALGVLLLVTTSTLPLALPFALLGEPAVALRASHAVGVAMLFGLGVVCGRYGNLPALRTGLWMGTVGLVLVALTLALGG